jgi:hypothetical protein
VLELHVSQGVAGNIKVFEDCLTSIRYKPIFLENPITNAMTIETLPQSTFIFLKHRDDNHAKIHPKMFQNLYM